MVYLDIPILNDLLDDFTGSQTRVLSDFLESNVDVYELLDLYLELILLMTICVLVEIKMMKYLYRLK